MRKKVKYAYICYMNSTEFKYLPHYTYQDYEQWEGRWELIYGIPYAMESGQGEAQAMAPMPEWIHQEINLNVATELKSALAGCKKCKAAIPINWKINEDTVVQPDAIVVCEPFDKGVFLTKTPSMAFEILSPSTAKKDRSLKYELYENAGVKYYIIIHPIEKSAQVFLLENGKYRLIGTFTLEKFNFEIEHCHFDFNFGKIW